MGVPLAEVQSVPVEMEDASLSDMELAYHVRDALASVLSGDSQSYDQLVGVLHRRERLTPDDIALLVTCLKALSGVAQHIDIAHHKSLLSCICGMSLWNYGPDVMDALAELIISLAASGKFVDLCLEILVSNFMPPPSFSELLKQPCSLARKDQVLRHVHLALKRIADLVPLSPLRLINIIIDRIPIRFTSEPLLSIFVENILGLEHGCLREHTRNVMLLLVVDRLVELDVEIGWDNILQDDSSKGIFEMELEDEEGAEDDVDEDGGQPLKEFSSRKILGKNSFAEKLDSLMVLTFEHLKSCHESGHLYQVFEALLESFPSTVMTIYKSKFSQFVMFYACSLDPENCGSKFASVLTSIFMSSDQLEIKRVSAVAYLASYLSRAKFLSASYVASTLSRLVMWCSEYYKKDDEHINPKAHKVFYAGCQAIMYVLCFRMRSMLGVPSLKLQLINMCIEAMLEHPLKPLKVCLPSIVEEFLRQAQAANLFNVPTTFVFNGTLESEFSRAFGGLERLDCFFPFDPCLLRKSDRYIRPNFVYWSMVRTTPSDDEDECSSDEDVALDFGDEDGVNVLIDGGAGSFGEENFDLDLDVNKMSITPRNSLKHRFGTELQGGMRMPSRIRPSMSPESL